MHLLRRAPNRHIQTTLTGEASWGASGSSSAVPPSAPVVKRWPSFAKQEINDLAKEVAHFIITTGQPLSLADCPGFRNLLLRFAPYLTDADLPTRKQVSTTLLDILYNETEALVMAWLIKQVRRRQGRRRQGRQRQRQRRQRRQRQRLGRGGGQNPALLCPCPIKRHLGLNFDAYSKTQGGNHMLNVNAASNGTCVMLDLVPTGGASHTSQFLAGAVIKVLKNYDVTDKVVGVTTDWGANMRSSYDLLSEELPLVGYAGCAQHLLSLALKVCLVGVCVAWGCRRRAPCLLSTPTHSPRPTSWQDFGTIADVKETVAKAMRIVDYISKHTLTNAVYERYMLELKGTTLKKPCLTRFGSNVIMLQSLLDNWWAAAAACRRRPCTVRPTSPLLRVLRGLGWPSCLLLTPPPSPAAAAAAVAAAMGLLAGRCWCPRSTARTTPSSSRASAAPTAPSPWRSRV